MVRRAGRRHIVAQGQLEADEILKYGGDAGTPGGEIELAKVDAVDFDGSRLRIVQAAQELGEGRLARAVLSDDGERGAGRNREIEVLQHGRSGPGGSHRVGEGDIAKTNFARGRAVRRRDLPERSAPAGRIAGSRRSTAATGAAAPSSAQLNPPNAIIETPMALCTYTTASPRLMRPAVAALASIQKHQTFAEITRSMLQITGRSRRRVAAYCSSCRRVRRAMKRSMVQPARPKRRSSLLAGGSTARR